MLLDTHPFYNEEDKQQFIAAGERAGISAVTTHKDMRAFWRAVCLDPGITMELIKRHPKQDDLCWIGLSRNETIATWHEVTVRSPLHPWNWSCLTKRNSFATWEHILGAPNAPWDWYNLSRNSDVITSERYDAHPEFPYDWGGLRYNSSIATWTRICKDPCREWDWDWLSRQRHIATAEHISEHPEFKWNMKVIPKHIIQMSKKSKVS